MMRTEAEITRAHDLLFALVCGRIDSIRPNKSAVCSLDALRWVLNLPPVTDISFARNLQKLTRAALAPRKTKAPRRRS